MRDEFSLSIEVNFFALHFSFFFVNKRSFRFRIRVYCEIFEAVILCGVVFIFDCIVVDCIVVAIIKTVIANV